MLRNGTDTCKCPSTVCEIKGKCDECVATHGEDNTFCRRPVVEEEQKA